MIVAGGIYGETCARPHWNRLFGSGGRAAAAVAKVSPGTRIHSYLHESLIESYQASAAALGLSAEITAIPDRIRFEYLYPLARPTLYPPHIKRNDPLKVEGDVVLRFHFLEGDAVVKARRAVYDPQTGNSEESFFKNGSECGELAIVLNDWEAFQATRKPVDAAGRALMKLWGADVVVIKLGTQGALVFDGSREPQQVPSYPVSRVFKIGSGDVFSAIFTYCWGEKGIPAAEAALYASKAVADYVETRALPVAQVPSPLEREPYERRTRAPRVYLAGPFFDTAQRWLIEECRSALENLGAEVFSPIHDVGPAESVDNVAQADLEGLRRCDVVLALPDSKDPGTIFEVGYARALRRPKPVVVLAERFHTQDYTMFEGTGCIIARDLCTALYQSVWVAG